MADELAELRARVERLDATDQIRQLASKYALGIDMRNLDAIVGLYVDDVRVTKEESGHQALKRVMHRVLSTFTASVHHVGNHIIEFKDADNAEGIVYCRCEHEIGDKWVPMYLHYYDAYRRVNGRWYFRRRLNCALYAADILERPLGPKRVRWPGKPPAEGNWHESFASWKEFWADPDIGNKPPAPAAGPDKFIETMRRGSALPKTHI